MYVRNVHSETVAALRPGEGAHVDPAHRVVADAIAAGHLVAADAPTPQHQVRAELDRVRTALAESEIARARAEARVAELEQLLSLATEPTAKPPTKRAAREG